MKVGDKVCLRYNWSIVSTSPLSNSILIELLSEDMARMGEVRVSMYLDLLNVKPGTVYVRPSPFLPKDHPDYYQEFTTCAIWPENGLECEILLSPNFEENGMYSVVFKNSEKKNISRKAQKLDYEYWSMMIKEYGNTVFRGEDLSGIVTLIYYVSDKYEIDILKKVAGIETSLPFNAERIQVMFEQQNGNVIVLPIKFLKNGPS